LPALAWKAHQFWKREPEILQQGKTASTLNNKQQIKSDVLYVLTGINTTAEETRAQQLRKNSAEMLYSLLGWQIWGQ